MTRSRQLMHEYACMHRYHHITGKLSGEHSNSTSLLAHTRPTTHHAPAHRMHVHAYACGARCGQNSFLIAPCIRRPFFCPRPHRRHTHPFCHSLRPSHQLRRAKDREHFENHRDDEAGEGKREHQSVNARQRSRGRGRRKAGWKQRGRGWENDLCKG